MLNHRTLDYQHAVSLQTKRANVSETLEAQMKDKVNNHQNAKIGDGTTINPNEIKVSVSGPMAHFDFVKDMEGLNEKEKQHISRVIAQSVQQPTGGTNDYHVMSRAQSVAQLQLIAEKLIPAQYQSHMQQAIQKFEQEDMAYQVKLYEAAQSSMDKLSDAYPSVGKSTILQDGIEKLNALNSWTTAMYNGLDTSSTAAFVQSYEQILAQFKDQQLQISNNPESVLNQFQDELRTKWNDFASLLNDPSIHTVSTSKQSTYDIRL